MADPDVANPFDGVEAACRHHPYPARFPAGLAGRLISELSPEEGAVFDPFNGSGTACVAAAVLRREGGGGDVDALAGLLARVKLAARPAGEAAAWRGRVGRRSERIAAEVEGLKRARLVPGATLSVGGVDVRLPAFAELAYWFPGRAGVTLAAVARVVAGTRDRRRRDLGYAALSASVLGKWPTTVSYAQDVDHTRPHRVEQDVSPRRVVATFLKRLDRQIGAAGELHALYDAAGALGHAERAAGRLACPADARGDWAEVGVEAGSLDLVLTSPPYFNAVDYPRAHRLALCWMQPYTHPGLNGTADAWLKTRRPYVGLRHAPGVSADDWYAERPAIRRIVPPAVRRHAKWGGRLCGFFDDLSAVLARARVALRPGGHAAVVIGDNVVGGSRVPVARVLAALAGEGGFDVVSSTARRIAPGRRRYPVGPFGFDGPMTRERVVVLRRP